LRFLWNGELRVSRLFKIGEGSQLLDASEEKRKDLRGEGVDVNVAEREPVGRRLAGER